MKRVGVIVAAAALAATAAYAAAPETSLRPVARPGSEAVAPAPRTQPQATQPEPRTGAASRNARVGDDDRGARSAPSRPRDGGQDRPGVSAPQSEAERRVEQQGGGGLFSSLRPLLRPLGIGREAQRREEALRRGMVCNDPSIQGDVVGRVPGRIAACGIDDAVRVRSVSGITLSQHALMDCRTAGAVKTWVEQGVKPAVGDFGGGVAQLSVAAHYACRTRNNQRGAKISEHGKGKAIDISGFVLRDGSTITLSADWDRGQKGRMLRQMHRVACGPFGTVLGPESDRFHRNHFHFDTARHRGGSYCR